MAFKSRSVWHRFWDNVEETDTCWIWRGCVDGLYGKIGIGNTGKQRSALVHRVAYELQTTVELPETLVLDHLCRNKLCVRASHLDPVTFEENSRRARTTHGKSHEKWTGQRKMSRSSVDRFYEKFIKTESCWLWTPPPNAKGYGQFGDRGKMHVAHRWSYAHFKGPIPPGLVLDHLCEVKLCVNPDHLEPVTQSENVRRSSKSR